MKKPRVLLLLLLSTVSFFVAAAQPAKLPNGTIVESQPCATAAASALNYIGQSNNKKGDDKECEYY